MSKKGSISNDANNALTAAIASLEKSYGKGAIMRLDEDRTPDKIQAIPSGSIGLDIALGIGGLPRGRVIGNLRPRVLW